jgi:hypothetical protein
MLREQFYIDIMVKILERIITKGELELWQSRAIILAEKGDDGEYIDDAPEEP